MKIVNAIRTRKRWDICEPEFTLIAHMVHRAAKDALQTRNEGLSDEAWNFLDSFVPELARKLRTKQQEKC
jgi:hypothetical protein